MDEDNSDKVTFDPRTGNNSKVDVRPPAIQPTPNVSNQLIGVLSGTTSLKSSEILSKQYLSNQELRNLNNDGRNNLPSTQNGLSAS